MKIESATIVRTIVLLLALVNQVLSATGHTVLPIEDAQVETIVSTVWTVAASVWAWWKNRAHTDKDGELKTRKPRRPMGMTDEKRRNIKNRVGRKKAPSLATAPDVIQKGPRIDHQPNWKRRSDDAYVYGKAQEASEAEISEEADLNFEDLMSNYDMIEFAEKELAEMEAAETIEFLRDMAESRAEKLYESQKDLLDAYRKVASGRNVARIANKLALLDSMDLSHEEAYTLWYMRMLDRYMQILDRDAREKAAERKALLWFANGRKRSFLK